MPQRHGRGPAPLFHDGRMFVEGINALRAVDAYNGRNLWEFALPNVLSAYSADHLSGTAVTGSNFCVAGDSVYVHDKKHCYRLDAATGRKLGEFPAAATRDGTPGHVGLHRLRRQDCCMVRWPIRSIDVRYRLRAGRHERTAGRIDGVLRARRQDRRAALALRCRRIDPPQRHRHRRRPRLT